jgi:hypothetical protein
MSTQQLFRELTLKPNQQPVYIRLGKLLIEVSGTPTPQERLDLTGLTHSLHAHSLLKKTIILKP